VVAEMQDGDYLVASPQPPDAVLVGQAIETPGAAYLDPKGAGNCAQLRDHARGLTPHD
jgi:hypothetical protein